MTIPRHQPLPARGSDRPPAWLAAGLSLLIVLACAANAVAQSRKPGVPPGLDPGGVAVAIASEFGIAYTDQMIARRLARDGEGELIGWDFVDEDRKPLASPRLSLDMPNWGVMWLGPLLNEAPGSRIVPFRARYSDQLANGRMAVFAARSPARILLVAGGSEKREDWRAFAEAADRFKSLLVIADAPIQIATYPAALEQENILSVASHEALLAGVTTKSARIGAIDLAVTSEPGSGAAAARIAALAARLQAADPKLEGAALKARIISFAKPLPAPNEKATRYGWIGEPHKLSP